MRRMIPLSSTYDTLVAVGPQHQDGRSNDAQASNEDPRSPAPHNTQASRDLPTSPAPSKQRVYLGEIFPLPRIIAPPPAPSTQPVDPPSLIPLRGKRRAGIPSADEPNGNTEELAEHTSADEGPTPKRRKVASGKGKTVPKASKAAVKGGKGIKGGNGSKKAGKITVKAEDAEDVDTEQRPPTPPPQRRRLRSQAAKEAVANKPRGQDIAGSDDVANPDDAADSDWYAPFSIVPCIHCQN